MVVVSGGGFRVVFPEWGEVFSRYAFRGAGYF